MSKSRKQYKQPQRLTDFYPAARPRDGQDGAGSRDTLRSPHGQRTVSHAPNSQTEMGEISPPSTPTTRSPAKTRQRIEGDELSPGLQHVLSQASTQGKHTEPLIDAFPASDQNISVNTMKNMLLSLRRSLFNDFSDMFAPLNDTVQTHTTQIQHLESKMADLYTAHNDLVDAYTDQESEMQRLQNKIADLEDRSRRNNIKFRGIPESIPPNELTNFVQRLMKALIPSLTDIKLCVDRAHRTPKPKFLPDTAPRDTLARIHYYHVKELNITLQCQRSLLVSHYTQIYLNSQQRTERNSLRLQKFCATTVWHTDGDSPRNYLSRGMAKYSQYTLWKRAYNFSSNGNCFLQMHNCLLNPPQNVWKQNRPNQTPRLTRSLSLPPQVPQ